MWVRVCKLIVVVLLVGASSWLLAPTVQAWSRQTKWLLGWLIVPPTTAADPALTTPGHWAGDWWAVLRPQDGDTRLVVSPYSQPANASAVVAELNYRELDGEIAFPVANDRYYFWQTATQFWPIWIPAAETVTASGQLLISEVMYMGSDQWLELYNPTGVRRQLQGVRISNGGSGGGDALFSRSYILSPYSLMVVSLRTGSTSALGTPPQLVADRLFINQSNSTMQLVAGNGVVVDQLPSGSWPAVPDGVASGDQVALQRHTWSTTNTWEDWEYCLPGNPLCRGLPGITWKETAAHYYGTPGLPPL